jgi:glycosyltransferase involved in cell wall biosynthesis
MTRPLRIALVTAFPPGKQTLNEYGLHLAKGLAERADVAEVIVLADVIPEAMPELDLGPKITVKRCWSFNSLLTLPKLTKEVRRAKADGVLWNLQMATFGDKEVTAALGLLAPMAARMTGTTSGVIAHNIVEGVDLEQTMLKGQPLRQAMVRLGGRVINAALLRANYMTVTLRSYHEGLLSKSPSARVHLVPHGTFDTNLDDLIPVAQRSRKIVTMGKFGTYKRLETLLTAFDLLRKNPENANLELVIGGSDHPNTPGYLDGLAASRADDSGVTFVGYVAEDDIPGFFGNARLSVFDYSSTTGSSGVLHQTACYGAVPVFPRIGDFVDVCEDEGISGVNYTSQDANDMAAQMQMALSNEEASQQIAVANRDAALGFPFSEVVDFHIRKITAKIRGSRQHGVTATAQTIA